jgi:hypothetical protein
MKKIILRKRLTLSFVISMLCIGVLCSSIHAQDVPADIVEDNKCNNLILEEEYKDALSCADDKDNLEEKINLFIRIAVLSKDNRLQKKIIKTLESMNSNANDDDIALISNNLMYMNYLLLEDTEKLDFIKKAQSIEKLEMLLFAIPESMALIKSDSELLNNFCHQLIVIMVYQKLDIDNVKKVLAWLPMLYTQDSKERIEEVINFVNFNIRSFSETDKADVATLISDVKQLMDQELEAPMGAPPTM